MGQEGSSSAFTHLLFLPICKAPFILMHWILEGRLMERGQPLILIKCCWNSLLSTSAPCGWVFRTDALVGAGVSLWEPQILIWEMGIHSGQLLAHWMSSHSGFMLHRLLCRTGYQWAARQLLNYYKPTNLFFLPKQWKHREAAGPLFFYHLYPIDFAASQSWPSIEQRICCISIAHRMSGANPPPHWNPVSSSVSLGVAPWLLQSFCSCSMDSSSLSLDRLVAGERNGEWWPVLPLNNSHGMYLTASPFFILYF